MQKIELVAQSRLPKTKTLAVSWLLLTVLLSIVAVDSQTVMKLSTSCTAFSMEDNTVCISCASGFQLYTGICYFQIRGCVEYALGNICKKCQKGSLLVNNECCDHQCMNKIILKYTLDRTDSTQEKAQSDKQIEQRSSYSKVLALLLQSFSGSTVAQVLQSSQTNYETVQRYTIQFQMSAAMVLTCVLDYDTLTNSAYLVHSGPRDSYPPQEILLNQASITSSKKHQEAFRYASTKFNLNTLGMAMSRMAVVSFSRGGQYSFVFTGDSAAFLVNCVLIDSTSASYVLSAAENSDINSIRTYLQQQRSGTLEVTTPSSSSATTSSQVVAKGESAAMTINQDGSTTITTSSFDSISKTASEEVTQITTALLEQKNIKVSPTNTQMVQRTEGSTTNTYTIVVGEKQSPEQTQVTLTYNPTTKTTQIVDVRPSVATVQSPIPQPIVKPSTPVPITNPIIPNLVKQAIATQTTNSIEETVTQKATSVEMGSFTRYTITNVNPTTKTEYQIVMDTNKETKQSTVVSVAPVPKPLPPPLPQPTTLITTTDSTTGVKTVLTTTIAPTPTNNHILSSIMSSYPQLLTSTPKSMVTQTLSQSSMNTITFQTETETKQVTVLEKDNKFITVAINTVVPTSVQTVSTSQVSSLINQVTQSSSTTSSTSTTSSSITKEAQPLPTPLPASTVISSTMTQQPLPKFVTYLVSNIPTNVKPISTVTQPLSATATQYTYVLQSSESSESVQRVVVVRDSSTDKSILVESVTLPTPKPQPSITQFMDQYGVMHYITTQIDALISALPITEEVVKKMLTEDKTITRSMIVLVEAKDAPKSITYTFAISRQSSGPREEIIYVLAKETNTISIQGRQTVSVVTSPVFTQTDPTVVTDTNQLDFIMTSLRSYTKTPLTKTIEVLKEVFTMVTRYTGTVQGTDGVVYTFTIDKKGSQATVVSFAPRVTAVTTQNAVIQTPTTTATSISIDKYTGSTTTTTTDTTKIANSQTVTATMSTLTNQMNGFHPVATTSTKTGDNVLETIVVTNGFTSQQITSSVNTVTQKVTVLEVKPVEKTANLVPIIPEPQTLDTFTFNKVLKENVQVKEAYNNVFKQSTSLNIEFNQVPKTTYIADYPEIKKIDMVFEDKKGAIKTVTTVVNKVTNKAEVINVAPVPAKIESISYTETVSQTGQTTLISNNYQQVVQTTPTTQVAFNNVKKSFPTITQETVKTVQVVKTATTEQYTFVSQSTPTAPTTQVTVSYNPTTQKTTIMDVQTQPVVAPKPSAPEPVKIYPVEFKQPIYQPAIQTVTNFKSDQIAGVKEVVSISKSVTSMSTEYSMVVKTTDNKEVTVVVQEKPNQTPQIINTIPFVEEKKVLAPVSVKLPQMPSDTQILVNSVTGTKVIETTDRLTLTTSSTVTKTMSKAIESDSTLTKFVPISSTSWQTGQITTQSVIVTDGKTTKQVTSIINGKTGETTIQQVQPKEMPTDPTVHVSASLPITTISESSFRETIREDKTLTSIYNHLLNNLPIVGENPPTSTTLTDFATSKTMNFIYTNQDKTITQVTALYDKATKTTQIIDTTTAPKPQKQIVFHQTTTTMCIKQYVSTAVAELRLVDHNINAVLKTLAATYKETETELFQSGQICQKALIDQYVLVIGSSEVTQYTIERVKETNRISITDVTVLSRASTFIHPMIPINSVVNTDEITDELKRAIIQAARTSAIDQLTHTSEIVSMQKVGYNMVKRYIVEAKTTSPLNTVKFTVERETNGITYRVIDFPRSHSPQVLKVPVQPDSTTMTTNAVTGAKSVTTTDTTVIEQSVSAAMTMQKLTSTSQQFVGYKAISAITEQTGQFVTQTLVVSKGTQFHQVTSMINQQTNTVEIIESKVMETTKELHPLPTQNVQSISSMAFSVVVDQNPTISQVYQTVKRDMPQTTKTQPVQTTVTSYAETTKVVMTFAQQTGERVDIVTLTNKKTGETKVIGQAPVPAQVEPIIFKQEVVKSGMTVIKTNDIVHLTQVAPATPKVISFIQHEFPTFKPETVQVVEVEKQPNANVMKFVSKSTAKTNTQITVSYDTQTHKITVSDVQTYPIVQQAPKPVPLVQKSIPITQPVIKEAFKALRTDTTSKITTKTTVTSATVSTTQVATVYNLVMVDEDGEQITASVMENPVTQEMMIMDVTTRTDREETSTTVQKTFTNSETGVIKTVSNQVQTINREIDEMTILTDFIHQSFPEIRGDYDMTSVGTEKYQRTTLFTVVFVSKDKQKVYQFAVTVDRTQTAALIDARQRDYVDASSQLPKDPNFFQIPGLQFDEAATANPIIKQSYDSVIVTDFTLSGKKPSKVIFFDLSHARMMIFMFESENYNQRSIVLSTSDDPDPIVIDLAKVLIDAPLLATSSSMNSAGNQMTFTTEIETLSKTTPNFPKVRSFIIEKIAQLTQATIISAQIEEMKYVRMYRVMFELTDQYVQVGVAENIKNGDLTLIQVTVTPKNTILPEIRQPQTLEASIDEDEADKTAILELLNTELLLVFGGRVTIESMSAFRSYISIYFDLTLVVETGERVFVSVSKNPVNKEFSLKKVEFEKPVFVVEEAQADIVTSISVDEVTGATIKTTNDMTQISHMEDMRHALDEGIKQAPQLANYEPVGVTTQQSGDITTRTILVTNGRQTVQVTTVTDSKTDKTIIVENRPVSSGSEPCTEPKIQTETMSTKTFETAKTTNVLLQTAYQQVVTSQPKYVNQIPKETKITEYPDFKKYDMVFTSKTSQNSQVVTTIVNKIDKKTTVFETVEKPAVTTPMVFEKHVEPMGATKIVTNSIIQLTKEEASTPKVLEFVTAKYPQITAKTLETVQVVKQLRSNEFTFIAKTSSNTVQQVTASFNTESKTVSIINVQQQSIETTAIMPKIVTPISIAPTEIAKPQVQTMITEIKKMTLPTTEDQVRQIKSVEKITTTTGEKYVLHVVTSTEKEATVIVETKTGEKPRIADVIVQAPVAPVVVSQVSIPKTLQVTTVQVNTVSGVKSTTTTNPSTIMSTPSVVQTVVQAAKTNPVLHNYQPVSSTIQDSPTFILQSVVVTNGQENVQITSMINKETSKTTILETKTTSAVTKQIPMEPEKPTIVPLPEMPVTSVDQTFFTKTLETNKGLRTVYEVVGQSMPEAQVQKPTSTTITTVADTQVVSMTFTSTTTGEKTQVTSTYSTKTGLASVVTSGQVPKDIAPLTFEQTNTPTCSPNYVSSSFKELNGIIPATTEAMKFIVQTYPEAVQSNFVSGEICMGSISQTFAFLFTTQKGNRQVKVRRTVSTNKYEIVDANLIQPQQGYISIAEPVQATITPKQMETDEPFEVIKKVMSLKEINVTTVSKMTRKTMMALRRYTVYVSTLRSKGVIIIDVDSTRTITVFSVTEEPVTSQIAPSPVIQSIMAAPSTQSSVDMTTGTTSTTTTDQNTISKSVTVQQTMSEVTKQNPSLASYMPVASTQQVSGSVTTQTVIMTNGVQNFQVTSIISESNKAPIIVEQRPLPMPQPSSPSHPTQPAKILVPSVPTTTITQTQFAKTVETNQILSSTMKTITTKQATLPQGETLPAPSVLAKPPISTTISDFVGSQQIVLTYPKTETTRTVVTSLYNKQTKETKVISSSVVEMPTKQVTVSDTTSTAGVRTVVTNSITKAKTINPTIAELLNFLKKKYTMATEESIKAVKVVSSTTSMMYYIQLATSSSSTQIIQVIISRSAQGVFSYFDEQQAPAPVTVAAAELAPVDVSPEELDNPQMAQMAKSITNAISSLKSTIKRLISIKKTIKTAKIIYIFLLQLFDSKRITFYIVLNTTTNQFTIESYTPEGQPDVAYQASAAAPITITNTNPTTGTTTTQTTDQTVIRQSNTVQATMKAAIQQNPSLANYSPLSSTTVTNGQVVTQTVVLTNGQTTTQLTSIVNPKTGAANVIQAIPYTAPTNGKPMLAVVPSVTIPSENFQTAITQSKFVQNVYTNVQQKMTNISKQTPVATVMTDFNNVMKVEMMFEMPDGTQNQVTSIISKSSNNAQIISVVPMPAKIEPVTTTQTVNANGQAVLVSNNLAQVKQLSQPTVQAITAVQSNIKGFVPEDIKTVKVVTSGKNTEYTFATQTKSNTINQITVSYNTQTKESTIINVASQPAAPPAQALPKQKPQTVVPVAEISAPVQKLVQTPSLSAPTITHINSVTKSVSSFETVYKVEGTTSTGQTVTVVVNEQPNKQPTIIEATKPKPTLTMMETMKEAAPITPKTTQIVDSVTNTKTTTSTNIETIRSQTTVTNTIKEFVAQNPSYVNFKPIASNVQQVNKGVEVNSIILTDGVTKVQVSSITNMKTQSIEIVQHKTVTPTPAELNNPEFHASPIPTIKTTTIDESIFKQTVKENVEFQKIYESISSQLPSKEPPLTTTISQFQNKELVTMTFSTTSGIKTQVTATHDSKTGQTSFISSNPVPQNIQSSVIVETVTDMCTRNFASTILSKMAKVSSHTVPAYQFVQKAYTEASAGNFVSGEVCLGTLSETFTFVFKGNLMGRQQVKVRFTKTSQSYAITDASVLPNTNDHVIEVVDTPETELTPEETTSDEVHRVVMKVQTITQISVVSIQTIRRKVFTSVRRYTVSVKTIRSQGIVIVDFKSNDIITVVSYSEEPTAPLTKPAPIAPTAIIALTTTMTVDSVSGTTTIQSTDKTVIQKSETVQKTITEVVKTNPTLQSFETIASTTQTTGKFVTQSITMTNGVHTVQVTALIDPKTNQATVVEQRPVTAPTPTTTTKPDEPAKSVMPTVETRTVTKTQFVEETKTSESIQKIIKSVTNQSPQLVNVTPKSTSIQTYPNQQVATMVFETKGVEKQVVVVQDTTTKVSRVVSSQTLPTQQKPVYLTSTTKDEGTKVTQSNSIEQISTIEPNVNKVFQTVMQQQPTMTKSTIVGVTVQSNSITEQYTFTTNKSKTEQTQVTVMRDVATGIVKVLQTVSQPAPAPQTLQPTPLPAKTIPQTEYTSPVIKPVISVITNYKDAPKPDVIQSVEEVKTSEVTSYTVKYTTENIQYQAKVIQTSPNSAPKIVEVNKIDPTIKPTTVQVTQTVNKDNSVSIQYPTSTTFKTDPNQPAVTSFLTKEAPTLKSYSVQTVTKTVRETSTEYTLMMKNPESPTPQQVKVTVNNQDPTKVTLVENKPALPTAPTSSTPNAQPSMPPFLKPPVTAQSTVVLSEVQRQQIQMVSELNQVKTPPQFKEVPNLTKLETKEEFVQAVHQVKNQYPLLLKDAIIVKVMEKPSLDKTSSIVVYKANNVLYQATLTTNSITNAVTFDSFSKVGSPTTATASDINIGVDLAYGYLPHPSFGTDPNIKVLNNYISGRYKEVKDGLIQSVQRMELMNGRVNYKILYKSSLSSSSSVKFIVYYEPAFQRILEIKSTTFSINGDYTRIESDSLLADQYFRQCDSQLRSAHNVSSASVVNAQKNDDGHRLIYRIIYNLNGEIYHGSIGIDKRNQAITENYWNKIIELPVPTEHGSASSSSSSAGMSSQQTSTKIETSSANSNVYYTQVHRAISQKYASQIAGATLINILSRANLFSYSFQEFYRLLDDSIYSVEGSFNPNDQTVTIEDPWKQVDLYNGYTPVSAAIDSSVGAIRDFLFAQSNVPSSLQSATMIESGVKPLMGQVAYRIVLKDSVSSYTYIVYVESQKGNYQLLASKVTPNEMNLRH